MKIAKDCFHEIVMYNERCEIFFEKQFLEKHGFGGSQSFYN